MPMLPLALLAALQAPAATPVPAAKLPSDAVVGDWRAIPDDEVLVMTLADHRSVVIRLAPRYAPAHVANIRRLARARWWDASSIYRVQENWVAQWGDATEKKPLPADVVASPPPEFEIAQFAPARRMMRSDAYSTASGVTADGWPVASDGRAAWLTHCYGMVGVARDALPNTGSGAELFTPIGQTARRLDRNYTVVGRVIEGMRFLSALPRSTATMGVYATAQERTGIESIRLASDIPAAARPHFEYRAADNPRYAALITLKEKPAAPTVASGGMDVCDAPLPVRRIDIE